MARFFSLVPEAAAIAIFAMTYLVVAIGRLPGFRLDRAGAALVGASLMVAVGALPLEEAPKAIDFDTIILLLGVMIVVANLRLSGFFRLVNGWVVTRARYPIVLLASIVLVSGMLSAFLVNDTVCLVLTPLVLDLVTRLRRNPVPYLLAIAMASNIGSTATITGNPQNMIIGSLSHIPYGTFAAALSPIAGIGLVLTVGLIALVYRSEFWTRQRLRGEPEPAHADWPIIVKSVAVSLAMIAAFFAGIPPAEAAIVAGAVLLLTRRIKSEKVYAEIDWTLLLMFAGLFIVVAGLEHSVLSPEVIGAVGRLHLERVPVLSGDHRDPLEYRQQRPGSARAEAVHRAVAIPAAGLAHCRNGLDPRRQFYPGRLGRQSDRRAAGKGAKCRNRVLGILQGRRAIDGTDDRYRRAVARIRVRTCSERDDGNRRRVTRRPRPVRARRAPRLRSRPARPNCRRPRLFRNRPR